MGKQAQKQAGVLLQVLLSQKRPAMPASRSHVHSKPPNGRSAHVPLLQGSSLQPDGAANHNTDRCNEMIRHKSKRHRVRACANGQAGQTQNQGAWGEGVWQWSERSLLFAPHWVYFLISTHTIDTATQRFFTPCLAISSQLK